MFAWRLKKQGDGNALHSVALESVPIPELSSQPWERCALVKIHASALNHRDNWMTMGMYPRIRFDAILGADGSGVVTKVSDNSKDSTWVGQQVIIDSSLDWGHDPVRPSAKFSILGMPADGTFASYIAVPISSLRPKPMHLTHCQAAAIPLAGITAFRALVTKGKAQRGSNVLITGIGGGVALLAMQFAIAIGCRVYVTSGSEDKLERAKKMGATEGFNYRNSSWAKDLLKALGKDRIDVVVDGAGGDGISKVLRVMNGGGRVVSYGVTAGPVESLNLALMFLNNVDLMGTAMGSPEDFDGMLNLVNQHKIVPQVDTEYKFTEFPQALERMRSGSQFGKLVLHHPQDEQSSNL